MILKRNRSLLLGGLLVGLSLCLGACSKNEEQAISPESKFFHTGMSSGEGVFFSNLLKPAGAEVDGVHKHMLELDVNNDFVKDYRLVSEEKWDKSKQPEVLISKELRLEILNGNWVVDKGGSQNTPAILEKEQSLAADKLTWSTSSEMIIAAYYPGNPALNNELWNGVSEKYIGLKVIKGEEIYLAWLKISVNDFDNYQLHNYASRKEE